jgi:hypothetical protein
MRHLYSLFFTLAFFFLFLGANAQFTTNVNAVATSSSPTSNCFRLTEATNYQVGSVWNNTQVDLSQNFVINTKLYFGADDAGADGLAFVLQNSGLNAIGEHGGGIGYLKMPGNSFIIEFDTYYNAEPWFNVGDPVDDHIGFQANGDPYHNSWEGNSLKAPESFGFNIEDGMWHDATFSWNASTKTMTVQIFGNTYSYTGDIVKNIFGNNSMVYWGFTAATGSYVGNEHGVCIITNTPPPPPTCGQLRTQTPGGWGAEPHGNNPGTYLHANFSTAFPSGLTVGVSPNYNAHFTSAQAITDYLPAGGQAKALTKNYTDPATTSLKNTLVDHLVALTLSVKFDQTDPSFGQAGVQLGNMLIGSGTFANWTVSNFLAEANKVLGGASSSYSVQQVLETASAINENYVDGTKDGGYLKCPTTTQTAITARSNRAITDAETVLSYSAQPNPTRGQFELRLANKAAGTAQVMITNAMGNVVENRTISMGGKGQTLKFDLGKQAAGIYFIRVVTGEGVQTQKILVQK